MTTRRVPRVWRLLSDSPWAILPATMESIVELLELRAGGQMFTDAEIQARIGTGPRAAVPTPGAVAVLPLFGVISPRMNLMTQVSGGTSAEAFGKVFRAAIADPDIAAIVLDVDSPGGNVFGIEELAAIIRGARGRKPIIAVADTMMASAAYWIAAQSDQILASPSAQVGSIGVIGVHQDISAAEAKEGIKTTLITAGKFKGDGNEHEPLSHTARASMQQLVDSYYAAFGRDVARGRAVTGAEVRDGFGEGRILGAQAALKAGLVDGIGTLEQAIALAASGGKRAPVVAQTLLDPAAEDFRRRLAAHGESAQLAQDAEERADFRRRLAAHERHHDDDTRQRLAWHAAEAARRNGHHQ